MPLINKNLFPSIRATQDATESKRVSTTIPSK